MPNVYDCFMYHNETDMAELRIKELQHAVNYHVVCEARETHSGMPKELNFDAVYKRLPAYLQAKIIYVVVDQLSDGTRDSWKREAYHRSCIERGLVNAQPDDLVIVGDCDEIVSPDVIPLIKDKAGITMDLYYYDVNHKVREFWGIGATRWGVYQDINGIRTNAMGGEQLVGGWHLSYFGDTSFIMDKLSSFMHHDMASAQGINADMITYAKATGRDLWGRGDFVLDYIPFADGLHLPRTIRDNYDHYQKLGWIR
jgi:beta-1,4-mannosyl-glycoprotein beta-1,4-N-acetylglucosaminyltransferase